LELGSKKRWGEDLLATFVIFIVVVIGSNKQKEKKKMMKGRRRGRKRKREKKGEKNLDLHHQCLVLSNLSSLPSLSPLEVHKAKGRSKTRRHGNFNF
jgi:hypothetical protein